NYTLKNFSVGAKYFITDHININLSGAYIMNIQPDKPFIEGESFSLNRDDFGLNTDPSYTPAKVDVSDIYASKAILGAVTNRLFVQLGSEYYFNTKNQRIFPYLGIFGQFKMARIESYYPYTGMNYDNEVHDAALVGDPAFEEVDLWLVNRGGQALGFGGGINFGVEYALMEGLFIGAEVAPVCYQYTLLHLQIAGQDAYYAMNHNLRAFAYPQLTIGVRF
ncbi:MAG: hypothetical protein II607_03940, partial [Bacteroidales bacterium]|nr:hypothetical protein [Bacteroidales bacterium]